MPMKISQVALGTTFMMNKKMRSKVVEWIKINMLDKNRKKVAQ
jgi:hypothetical protein